MKVNLLSSVLPPLCTTTDPDLREENSHAAPRSPEVATQAKVRWSSGDVWGLERLEEPSETEPSRGSSLFLALTPRLAREH